jgi:long-chain acyl-CoA synthetase
VLLSPDRLISRGSPFELQEADVGGVVCRVFKHAPKTLADLYRACRRSSSQEFLVCRGRRFTYAEMFKWAAAAAQVLVERCCVQNGSRVALILDNGPEWVAAFIGITALGATVVAVHKRSASATIRAALDAARCSLAVTDGATVKLLHGHHDLQHILVVDGSSVDFTADRVSVFPGRATEGNEALLFDTAAAAPEQVGLIAFTSGSTGQPKDVELTHRGILCGLILWRLHHEVRCPTSISGFLS